MLRPVGEAFERIASRPTALKLPNATLLSRAWYESFRFFVYGYLKTFSANNLGQMEPVRPGHGDLRELVVTGRAVVWIDRETRFFPDVKPGPFGGRFERIEGPRAATTVSVLNDQGPPGDRGIVGQAVRREKPTRSPLAALPYAGRQRAGQTRL